MTVPLPNLKLPLQQKIRCMKIMNNSRILLTKNFIAVSHVIYSWKHISFNYSPELLSILQWISVKMKRFPQNFYFVVDTSRFIWRGVQSFCVAQPRRIGVYLTVLPLKSLDGQFLFNGFASQDQLFVREIEKKYF